MEKISYKKQTSEYVIDATCDANHFAEAMMAKSPNLIGPLCLCLLYGLRLLEALSLHWRDIDFDKDVLHIRRTMVSHRNPETVTYPENKILSIPLSAKLKEVLLKLKSRDNPQPDTPVFSREGKTLRGGIVQCQLRRLTESSAYSGFSFYDLRRASRVDQKSHDHSFHGLRRNMGRIRGLARLAMSRHPESYGPVLGLMSYTDLSLGETLGLHWNDIDLHNNIITVRRTIDDQLNVSPPKMGEHKIHLPPEARYLLSQYRKISKGVQNAPQVFHDRRRYLHMSSLVKRMQRLVSEHKKKNLTRSVLKQYTSQLNKLRQELSAER